MLRAKNTERVALLHGSFAAPNNGSHPSLADIDLSRKSASHTVGRGAYGSLSSHDVDEQQPAPVAQTSVSTEVIKQLHILKLAEKLYRNTHKLLRKDLVLHDLKTRKENHKILWAMFATNSEEALLQKLPDEIDKTLEKQEAKKQSDQLHLIQAFYQEDANNLVAKALKVIAYLRAIMLEGKEKLVAEDLNAAACQLPADIDINALAEQTTKQLNETYVKQKIAALYLTQIIALIKAKADFNQGIISPSDKNKLELYQAQLVKLQVKVALLENAEKQQLSSLRLSIAPAPKVALPPIDEKGIPPKVIKGLNALNTAFALYKTSTKLLLKEIDLQNQQKARQKFPTTFAITSADEKSNAADLGPQVAELEDQLSSAEYTNRFARLQQYVGENAEYFVAAAIKVLNHLHVVIIHEKVAQEDLRSAACQLPACINLNELVNATAQGIDETYLKQKIAVIYLKQMHALLNAQKTLEGVARPADPAMLQSCNEYLAKLQAKMLSADEEYELHSIESTPTARPAAAKK